MLAVAARVRSNARPSAWVARTVTALALARRRPRPIRGVPARSAAVWWAAPSRSRSTSVSATRPAADPEWSVSRTAAPASRRSATCAASHSRPSSSRPENGSSSSSSGHPDWQRLEQRDALEHAAAEGRRGAGRGPRGRGRSRRAAASQSVAVSPRRRAHRAQPLAAAQGGGETDLLGHERARRVTAQRPARGAASPASTRSRLVLPLPFAPATGSRGRGRLSAATPDSTVRCPRRIVSAPASSNTGTPVTLTMRAHPVRRRIPARDASAVLVRRGWPLIRHLARRAVRGPDRCRGASVVVADPRWSPPLPSSARAKGRRCGARGHVAAP